MKIAVIDDDPMTLKLVEKKLTEKGHVVTSLADPVKALEIIEDKDFDVIISDVMMPGISGLTLLSICKQFYYKSTPVILISSLDQAKVIAASVQLGADEYITKPINFSELFLKIDRAFGKYISSRSERQ